MKISKLKALLESGAITQEEYDSMAEAAEKEGEPADPQKGGPPEEASPADAGEPDGKLERMVQAAVDRATNKLGNENKVLREKLEKERKKNLTAEEVKQLELQEKEQELAQKEKEIRDEKNRMYALKSIKKAGLDDGSEDTLDFVDFVMADEESDIDDRVKSLKSLIDARVHREVDRIFKENGRIPGKGGTAAKDNPWSKGSWNLTKQMELEINNPELAKTMKASSVR